MYVVLEGKNPSDQCGCVPWGRRRRCLEPACGIDGSRMALQRAQAAALALRLICRVPTLSPLPLLGPGSWRGGVMEAVFPQINESKRPRGFPSTRVSVTTLV